MKTMYHKVFNDAVHGYMTFHPLLVKIIDTPEFQRLRNLKQLGFAYYVYPSACHNRFEHSLGTCHLANKLLDALTQCDMEEEYQATDEEKLCVLIAGLCHDLGHGPFSHTWEKFLHKAKLQDSTVQSWKHEDASVQILERLFRSEKIKMEMEDFNLTDDHRKFIKELIRSPKDPTRKDKYYLYQIISNRDYDVDVDKWDYILRDKAQLNISISFDPHRMFKYCQVLPTDRARGVKRKFEGSEVDQLLEICFREKEVPNLLDMLFARACLHHKAYQHRAVVIIETMVIDAFLLANEKCPQWKLTDTSVENLLTLNDAIYYKILESSECEEAKKLLRRVETRNLYYCVYEYEMVNSEGTVKKFELSELRDLALKICQEYSRRNNNNLESLSDKDIEVVQICIDMGSKWSGDFPICYYYRKEEPNIAVSGPGDKSKHLILDQLQKYLRTKLLVLYKKDTKVNFEKSKALLETVVKDIFTTFRKETELFGFI